MGKRFNFTKAAITALPVPQNSSRAVYHDAKTAGLQLRVTANGIKTFSVFRRLKGGLPERVTLGRFPDMTIEQARTQAARINAEIADGKNPADRVRTAKGELTLAALFDEYLTRHAAFNRRPDKPQQSYRLYLAHWGNRKLSAIKHADVERWHKALPDVINKRREQAKQEAERVGKMRPGLKGTPVGGHVSANNALKLLHSMFAWAIKKRLWAGENPAHGVERFAERSRERFLQSNELPRFFAALADEPNPTIRDYFLVCLLTGARRANVLSMRWQDVNLAEGVWRIPITKNGTPQNVTLSAEAVEILKARKEADTPYVFPGNSKTGHLMEPKKGWQRVLARAGLSDLRIHDLRRTLGSWQAKTGASMVIIGKSLNHKNQQTTAIYARLDLDPVRQSVQRATAAMLAAGGLKPGADVVRISKK